jgi:N-acetylmuramoyl-L-alanine amidase
MSKDLNTINDYLAAKTKNTDYQISVSQNLATANNAYVANVATALGGGIGTDVNGFVSVDATGANLGSVTISGDVENTHPITSVVMTQITPNASMFPNTNLAGSLVDVAAGVYLVTDDLSGEITLLLQDSAGGEPLEDSSGNPLTQVVAAVPNVSVTVEDALTFGGGSIPSTQVPQTINQTIESLTGITPPDESITIVSLGGAAVSALTATIKVSAERKKSLLGTIKQKAAASSVEGLGDSITKTIDDATKVMDETINSSSLTQDVMGAVSAVQGIGDEVATAAASATNSLTGALTSTIGQVTSAIEDGFNSVIGAVETSIGNLVDDVIGEIETGFGTAQNLFEDLTGSVGETLQGLFGSSAGLSKNFVSDIIKDVLAGGDINLTKAAKKLALADGSLSPEMKSVISSVDADDPQEFTRRVVNKANARGIPASQITQFNNTVTKIESALSKVDTTISGTIVSQVGEFYTEDTDLAELVKRYLGADTTNFVYVDSKEELGLEMKKITRVVSEVIVHATETYTNANIGSEEIHLRHNDAGHNGIQYHYVIRRDGRLQRGMPIDKVSSASDINGHSLNCIDIALVGGINVPTEDENPLLNLSAQSFTQAQMKTLEAFLEVFYMRNPGGQVLGHNAIDDNSLDPYFDVISFVENKFGKKSVYEDPLTEQSLSAKELTTKRPV